MPAWLRRKRSSTQQHPRGADLRGADLRSTDLRGADLRGADLQGADLRGADLRDADLRGSNLYDADLGGSALHGADLRETLVGNAALGHRGGDPELTFIYNPEIWGARANDGTRWPAGFEVFGAGIVFDGPEILPLAGEVVNVPVDGEVAALQGRVLDVRGWLAHVETDTPSGVPVPGDQLLGCNLRLLRGQRAFHESAWWSIVGHDDAQRTLTLGHGSRVQVVEAALLLQDNAHRWWWHVPGSEYTARD